MKALALHLLAPHGKLHNILGHVHTHNHVMHTCPRPMLGSSPPSNDMVDRPVGAAGSSARRASAPSRSPPRSARFPGAPGRWYGASSSSSSREMRYATPDNRHNA